MEKKYTPKQRSAIYLKAAEIIENNNDDICCGAIQRAEGNTGFFVNTERILKSYPEFKLFKPWKIPFHGRWFADGDRDSRINCLLLAAEMTKDKL
jgi:hypothetical protein